MTSAKRSRQSSVVARAISMARGYFDQFCLLSSPAFLASSWVQVTREGFSWPTRRPAMVTLVVV
jgi:hypothetical protein